MAERGSSSLPRSVVLSGSEARPRTSRSQSQAMAQPMQSRSQVVCRSKSCVDPNDLSKEVEAIDLDSHSRSKPELKNLMSELDTIVDWHRLLLELGLEPHRISIIEKNHPSDVVGQRRDAFDQWLRDTPNADWKAIIDALYRIDENALAYTLEGRYNFKDPRPPVKDLLVSTPNGALIETKLVDESLPCMANLARFEDGLKYHTLQLTRPSILDQYVVIHEFFSGRIKDKMTRYLRSIERSDSKDDFKVGVEVRFGELYWRLPCESLLKGTCKKINRDLQKRYCFNTEVQSSDIDHLISVELRGKECVKTDIKRVPRVKIIIEGAYEGDYIAVIDEQDNGTFGLDSVYIKQPVEHRARFDVAIPGRKYDFRIADASAPLLSESDHSLSYRIAWEITASMHRLPNRKLSMMLRGETSDKKSSWKVEFIRQRVQRQYIWKEDRKWIVVLYDLDVFDATCNKTINLDEVPLNEAVEVPFNYSKKEVELWGLKMFPRDVSKTRPSREKCYYMESVGGIKLPNEEPQKPLEWTAEDLMAHFDEFVGDAFKIAKILDRGHP